jgi:hypothetical protein
VTTDRARTDLAAELDERLLAEPAGDRGGEEPFDGSFAAFGLAAE